MKRSTASKPRQWLLIMLCVMVFFSGCSRDELIEKRSEREPAVSKVEGQHSNALARGGIDPGIDDVVFDGWGTPRTLSAGRLTFPPPNHPLVPKAQ
jgi:hypothetical protein